MARRHINGADSVNALARLLRTIIDGEHSGAPIEKIRIDLNSQGCLAQYQNDDLGIQKMSLNTLKRNANSHLNGGYCYLDDLRKRALRIQSIPSPTSKSVKRSKAALELEISELKIKIVTLEENLVTLTQALTRALSNYRRCAAASGRPELLDIYAQEEREITAILSLRKG